MWGGYAKRILSLLTYRHQNAVLISCVNNVCNLNRTTNDDEQDITVSKMKNSPNVVIEPDGNFPISSQFKRIFQKSSSNIMISNISI